MQGSLEMLGSLEAQESGGTGTQRVLEMLESLETQSDCRQRSSVANGDTGSLETQEFRDTEDTGVTRDTGVTGDTRALELLGSPGTQESLEAQKYRARWRCWSH